MKAKLKALTHKKIFSLLCLLLGMCLVFYIWAAIHDALNPKITFLYALTHSSFLNLKVFRNILNSLVVPSFLTMGAGCLLIGGYMDLSLASIGCLGSMVMAVALTGWNLPWYAAVLLALVLCALLGWFNAFMVTKLHFASFIATLGMASMAKGLLQLVSSFGTANGLAGPVYFQNDTLKFFGSGMIGPIQLCILVMILFFVVYGILISKTAFGAKITLLGGGPVAATLAGINANALITLLFVNGAVLSGVAGVVTASRLGQGTLMALQTNQFTGMTAAILGGISFGGGVGGMGGAFIGLLILNTFTIGVQIVGLNPYWQTVFTGLLLLFALGMDFIAMARRQKALK